MTIFKWFIVIVILFVVCLLLQRYVYAAKYPHIVVASDGPAGPYCAFPGACRLPDGRIIVVYYNGVASGHVTWADQRKNGGCIAYTLSSDEGKTWSPPALLLDTELDDRDPDIAVLRDGRIILSYFRLYAPANRKLTGDGVYIAEIVERPPRPVEQPVGPSLENSGGPVQRQATSKLLGVLDKGSSLVTSTIAGLVASAPRKLQHDAGCSAPVRDYGDGHLLLGSYHLDQPYVLRSTDNGKSWQVHDIPNGGKHLDAETDTIQLADKTWYAALRGAGCNGHYSTSVDGKNWTTAKDIGFVLHCPALHRVGDIVLLAHRVPATAMHYSLNECKTWKGPVQVDSCGGAYPAFVTLKDGSVLIVYYTEGKHSDVRCRRFTVTAKGVVW